AGPPRRQAGSSRNFPPSRRVLSRMRALGDPDVDPGGRPESERWRPWRSYAVRHLSLQTSS
ncbi:DNA-3-methyladenine glycosylase 2 family protein, partial [Streptomyces sp. NPDC002785]